MQSLLLFILIAIGGLLLEVIFSNLYYYFTKNHYKENHFTLGKYFFFLLMPLIGVATIVQREGPPLFNVFLVFAAVGTILELLVGFSYQKIVGQRLWTYHKFSITKHTSWLSIPIWGMGGVLFWLLAKVFL